MVEDGEEVWEKEEDREEGEKKYPPSPYMCTCVQGREGEREEERRKGRGVDMEVPVLSPLLATEVISVARGKREIQERDRSIGRERASLSSLFSFFLYFIFFSL